MADLRNVYPPEIWVRESLMVLQNTHVMANLVHRDFDDAVAQFGDTVNTRKPDLFTTSTLQNSIGSSFTVAAATATPVQVVLDQHRYVAFAVTGRDQDTSIKNLIDEFMEPAAIPMAQAVDDDLSNNTNGLGSVATAVATQTAGALELQDFAETRGQLRTQQVPFTATNRQSRIHLVMGTDHETAALTVPELVTSNQSGFDPPPVQTGFISVIFGINVFADQGIPPRAGTTSAQSLAFHRNAMNLTTRPLEQIDSSFGIRSSVMSKDGISLRVMQSFQHIQARWLITLDMLYGFKLLDGGLATILQDAT